MTFFKQLFQRRAMRSGTIFPGENLLAFLQMTSLVALVRTMRASWYGSGKTYSVSCWFIHPSDSPLKFTTMRPGTTCSKRCAALGSDLINSRHQKDGENFRMHSQKPKAAFVVLQKSELVPSTFHFSAQCSYYPSQVGIGPIRGHSPMPIIIIIAAVSSIQQRLVAFPSPSLHSHPTFFPLRVCNTHTYHTPDLKSAHDPPLWAYAHLVETLAEKRSSPTERTTGGSFASDRRSGEPRKYHTLKMEKKNLSVSSTKTRYALWSLFDSYWYIFLNKYILKVATEPVG